MASPRKRSSHCSARATSYLALDKTREAAADLDEAVQADPNSAHAWSARGQAYERLGDKAKAAASYGRAHCASGPRTTRREAGWRAPAAKHKLRKNPMQRKQL